MFRVPNMDPKARENRFRFQVPRRHWWESGWSSLPFLHFVPLDVMSEARKVAPAEQLQRILELMGEDAAAKAVGRLNQPEVAVLTGRWIEASGVGLGELEASSGSSLSMRGQSEPISSETDSASTT